MNLLSLRYLVTIENCGSISKAAVKLFLSQPYLSRMVKELEEEFHITIFTRGKIGITPTDSGRIFLAEARALLEHADTFRQEFQADYEDKLRLRIAATTSSHAMDAYLRMLKSLSDQPLRFHYKEETNYDVINDIYTNAADVGVIIVTAGNRKNVETLLKMKNISYHKIFDMDTQLFVREGHPLLEKVGPLTLEDIYQYNFVMYASRKDIGPHSIENIYNENAMEDLLEWDRVKQIVYVYSRASLHNIVTQTDFMALGARTVMEQEKQFHFVTIPFPEGSAGKAMMEADTSLGYVYLKGRKLPPLAKQFIDTLIKYYGAV